MAEARTVLYEAMFLLSQQAEFGSAIQHVRDILTRARAEILVLRKWDERRLAYPISGQKRGTYVLAFFRAPTTLLANLERDCNLSETILRAMILKTDHMGEAELALEMREVDAASEARMRGSSSDAAPSAAVSAASPAPSPAAAPAPAPPSAAASDADDDAQKTAGATTSDA